MFVFAYTRKFVTENSAVIYEKIEIPIPLGSSSEALKMAKSCWEGIKESLENFRETGLLYNKGMLVYAPRLEGPFGKTILLYSF